MNKLLTAAALVLLPALLCAQSTTSAYSMFGIGEVETGNVGYNAGMAGVGIGAREYGVLNSANPASLTMLQPKMLVFHGSVFAKYSAYNSGSKTDSGLSANIQNFTVGMRLGKKFAASVGVVPLTSMDYYITKQQNVEGSTSTTRTTFEGSGGLSRVSASLGFNLLPNLSLGVNGNLAVGSIIQSENSDYWSIERTETASAVYLDFGAQYQGRITDWVHYSIGLVGGYKTRLPMEGFKTVIDTDGSGVMDESYKVKSQYIPEFYGTGVMFAGRRASAGLDYVFRRWSRVSSGSSTVLFEDTHQVSLGASLIPQIFGRKYFQRIRYQVGFTGGNSYLKLKGDTPFNYAVTAGAVFPVSMSDINVGLEYGKKGFSSSGKIREQYFKVTLGFTLRESAFRKYKFD